MENRDIICISYTTWFGKYTNSGVQLLSRLAKNNRVLFVEYPFTFKDIFTGMLGKIDAPVRKMLGLKPRLQPVKSAVGTTVFQLVVPPVIPVDWIKSDRLFYFFFRYNTWVYKLAVRKAMRKLGMKNPMVITAYNAFYGLHMIGKLDEAINVYYCYDGLETRRHGQRIIPVDAQYSRKVDGIIATSDFIKAEKEKFNPRCYVVKNGVDYALFSPSAKTKVLENKRKKVGYIGSLDHRFDLDIVEYAVKNCPDYDFYITGDFRNDAIKPRLGKYANVYFSGPIKPHEVPALLAQYDVGIIPYTQTEYNKSIYPLKINEFLAVGVPVVMTAFADLSDFKGMVSVAKNGEEFVKLLHDEIENDHVERIRERTEFAKSNSWDSRAEQFGDCLEDILAHRNL